MLTRPSFGADKQARVSAEGWPASGNSLQKGMKSTPGLTGRSRLRNGSRRPSLESFPRLDQEGHTDAVVRRGRFLGSSWERRPLDHECPRETSTCARIPWGGVDFGHSGSSGMRSKRPRGGPPCRPGGVGAGRSPGSWCGDTAHVPLIQVGTPIRGKIHRFKTNHKTRKPIGSRISLNGLPLFTPINPPKPVLEYSRTTY